MRDLFSDTVAADTIPLKLVVYLGLLAAVLILVAQAWNTAVLFWKMRKLKLRLKLLPCQSFQSRKDMPETLLKSTALKGVCVPSNFPFLLQSDTLASEWTLTRNAMGN